MTGLLSKFKKVNASYLMLKFYKLDSKDLPCHYIKKSIND